MKKSQYVVPALLFLMTVVLITVLIPVGGHYFQRYTLGEKWRGATLRAPFDFSISKSDAEIAADLRSVDKNFIPVYSVDTSVLSQNIEKTRLIVENERNSALLEQILRRSLTFIYNKGVAANLEHFYVDQTDHSYIRIDKEGTLETVSTAEVFSVSSALEYLNRQTAGYILSFDYDMRSFIAPNLIYNASLNAGLRESEYRNVAITKGIVYENETIVNHNQIIDQEVYGKLNSLQKEYQNRIGVGNSYYWVLAGHFLVTFIILFISYLFLFFFRYSFATNKRNILFVLSIYVLMVGLCSAVYRIDALSVYLIPFAIVPIYIFTFYDIRLATFEHITILLLCAMIVPRPFEFVFINFVSGIVGVYVLKKAYRRDHVFRAAGAVFLSNCLCYLAMVLIQEGNLSSFNYLNLIWFGVNVILFFGMYQLIYVLEKVFGFVSDVTLLELSDTNQKLLLELAHKAPGTFQHTLQVANLAEAAAKEIGARALLTRTGALYHDIGKMMNPAYFIENTNGLFNPHDSLTPSESADIIRKHVTDGVTLGRKQHLPAVIIDFITGHHANAMIYFFYAKQKELNGGETPDPSEFSYSGAKPISKEVSITMMADAVEAASRSLSEYTEQTIDQLVEKIIDTQIREGMFADSLLSFRDIARIKAVFKEKLGTIYHTRIAYPDRE